MNRRDFLKAELSMAAAVSGALIASSAAKADEKPHRTKISILLIASHPYPERSVLIRGLQQAAESVDGVTVRNLETIIFALLGAAWVAAVTGGASAAPLHWTGLRQLPCP